MFQALASEAHLASIAWAVVARALPGLNAPLRQVWPGNASLKIHLCTQVPARKRRALDKHQLRLFGHLSSASSTSILLNSCRPSCSLVKPTIATLQLAACYPAILVDFGRRVPRRQPWTSTLPGERDGPPRLAPRPRSSSKNTLQASGPNS